MIEMNEASLYQQLAEIKNKSPREIKKIRDNPNNYINSISDILYYVCVPKVGRVKLEMLKNIEANKKLLKDLE